MQITEQVLIAFPDHGSKVKPEHLQNGVDTRTDSVEGKKGGKTMEARVGNVGRKRAESRRAKRGGRKRRKQEASGSAGRSREAERVWGRVGGDESNERNKSSTKVRATIAKKGPRFEKRNAKDIDDAHYKYKEQSKESFSHGASRGNVGSFPKGKWQSQSRADKAITVSQVCMTRPVCVTLVTRRQPDLYNTEQKNEFERRRREIDRPRVKRCAVQWRWRKKGGWKVGGTLEAVDVAIGGLQDGLDTYW
ncbi:hypothetical protein EDB83DRAFT_2551008 [Lactarius deliciosus]|nr:hypothetical protein EDB83DRAFT_2551008 [Lactarius deliciosus]